MDPDSPPHDSSHDHDHDHDLPSDLKKPGAFAVGGALVGLLLALAGLFYLGSVPREHDSEITRKEAAARAADLPILAVTRPAETPGDSEVTLNCDVIPNRTTTILARATGYLKTLHAEIADTVKAGQLLAEIDTPEIDAELVRSKASLDQAKARELKAKSDLAYADRALKRDQSLKGNSISIDELDRRETAQSDATTAMATAKADVEYAEAEVKRLTALQSFERVVAPYDGRITFRFLDVGAYLSPDPGAHAELFTIAETEQARIIIHVPQSYATDVDMAGKPTLTVRNYPGREFKGTIAGYSGQFDASTRTMLFLLFFPNKDGALFPGMYGQVRVGLSSRKPVLQIPTSAILASAEGPRVMIVQEGVARLRPVTIGRDFGTSIEILAGLNDKDQVAVSPQAQITDGSRVKTLAHEQEGIATSVKAAPKDRG